MASRFSGVTELEGAAVASRCTCSLTSSHLSGPRLCRRLRVRASLVRVGVGLLIAALYHPPRPVYATANLLCHVEHYVAELSHDYPLAKIILAGDFNMLQDDDIVERTGHTQIVRQPTRGANLLDRVFVSDRSCTPLSG